MAILENRYNSEGLGTNQLRSIKDHFQQYFVIGQEDDSIIDLKLDIVGDETLTADCDVTDHYVESNTARQDQISLKPLEYTISGEIGELVWYQKDSSSQIFGQVAQRLEGVISFLPVRSKSFNQFKTKAMKALQWVDTASNAVSKVSNLWSQLTGGTSFSVSHQELAYQKMLKYRNDRQKVSIRTPWGILENYVITSIRLTQSKETRDKSQISISFKEFRTVSLGEYVEFDPKKYQGDAAFENQPKIDNGKTSGEDASLPTATKEVDGEKVAFCDVVYDDKDFYVSFSDKYGFSVQDAITSEWIPHDSADYKGAVSAATKECDEIIGMLK